MGMLSRPSLRAPFACCDPGLPAVNIAYVNADAADPPNEVSCAHLWHGAFAVRISLRLTVFSTREAVDYDGWVEGAGRRSGSAWTIQRRGRLCF